MTGDTHDSSRLAGAPWALVSYLLVSGASRAGILTPEGVRAVPAFGDLEPLALLSRWEWTQSELADLQIGSLPLLGNVELGLPIRYPSKILCAGANYHGHLREMGVPTPDPSVRPFFFFKPPTTTLVQDGHEIFVDTAGDAKIDWEVELGVVIGARVARVLEPDAMSAVAGYVLLVDVTDRSKLVREPSLAPPFGFDWVAAKAFDGSCPIGSTFVPAELAPDLSALRLRLWVNGVIKQDSTTADMVHDVPALVAAASETVTLEPGDIIATGTPAGVGVARGEFLKPGDLLIAEIEGIGSLRNPVVAR